MIDSRLTMLSMVQRHGTVTAAAHALRYSPSTVSHQVRQLSAELGVTLLEQHGRNVRLTPAAASLLRHVDAMSAEWESALAELGHAGTVRILHGGGPAPAADHVRAQCEVPSSAHADDRGRTQ